MVATDKTILEEHKKHATVVFDESLQGKQIDAIDKPLGLDFKDQGTITVPSSAQNMMCPGMKIPSKKFKKQYDEMEWMCDDCGEMHRKGVPCE